MTEPATTTATFAGGTTAIGSGQVADSYFDDAAFIGDSRTQGLQLYTGLPNATFYATQGLMVDTFFSKKFVKAGGGKITIPDAMKNQTFKKVYIMLGVNELGSDAAIEAADVVLMDDDPAKIALAMRIARRTKSIVYQNIVFALAIKAACLLLGALGIANMWAAIFADVGVMVLAVLNATRALYTKDLTKK